MQPRRWEPTIPTAWQVEKGQIQAQSIDNGIRFIYNLGDFSTNTTGIVPLYITQEKLDEICGLLDEMGVTNMRRYYSSEDAATGMLVLNGVAQKNIKDNQEDYRLS